MHVIIHLLVVIHANAEAVRVSANHDRTTLRKAGHMTTHNNTHTDHNHDHHEGHEKAHRERPLGHLAAVVSHRTRAAIRSALADAGTSRRDLRLLSVLEREPQTAEAL